MKMLIAIEDLHLKNQCCAKCSNCAYKIEDPDALFCAQCGVSLVGEGCCRFCGKPLPEHVKYCVRCGTSAIASTVKGSSAIQTEQYLHGRCEYEQEKALKRFIVNEVRHRVAEAQVERTAERTIQKENLRQLELLKFGIKESGWVVVSGGSYLMGSPVNEEGRFSNEQQHEVTVDNFEMFKTPVTFDMFDIYCDDLRRNKPGDETWGRGERPTINITYWAAMEYCSWLSKRTNSKIRLPTEAEWEYACRAGTTTPFSTGDTVETDQANFDGSFTYGGSTKGTVLGKTTPVKTFPPNPWGLYDMHGNVWEWCASAYDEVYSGAELEDAGYDPDDLRERVVRGGSWHNVPGGLRSASRNKLKSTYHYLRVGFRIVREVG